MNTSVKEKTVIITLKLQIQQKIQMLTKSATSETEIPAANDA